ncbi:MAG: dihydroorotase [Lachnospiraceae bacterium]|nr:dihydroorotase [Lachnospiraceae bacterium]
MLYIKNGLCIDPRTGMQRVCDILTEGERILKIGENLAETEEFKKLPRHEIQTIDAEGYIVAPGLVDVHVHFRDPGFTEKEDILTGAAAAAAGGFTSVVMMANTRPAADQADILRYMLEKGKDTPIHVYACGAVTKNLEGKELTDMKALRAAGAAGFTDDGKPLSDETLVRKAMENCKELGVPISFHEEDPAYIKESGVNAGEVSAKMGLTGADRQAEISLIERDIRLAIETGACVNIQHISTKEGVELVRRAKREGADIHAEATPHHFTLTQEAVLQYGTLAKMNPPLRTEEDKEAIIEGLSDGTIDLIATDHAPHTKEEKEKFFTEAPSGIIGLETALALGITELVEKKRLTMEELLSKMTWNPAKLYGIEAGYLAEGGPADIVIFDPDCRQTFLTFFSKASNSPFTGKTCKSEVEYTICAGKVAYIKNMSMSVLDD